MSSTTRIAGVAGTFSYTLNVVPFGIPLLTIYSDSLRTVVAVASTPTVATGNPSVFTCAYPATLAAGTYYTSFSTVVTNGQPPLIDADDTLILTSIVGNLNAYPNPYGYCQLSDVQARINSGGWDSTKTGALPSTGQVNQFILEASVTIDVTLRKTGYYIPLVPIPGLAQLPSQVWTHLQTVCAALATASVERTRHGSAEQEEDHVAHYWMTLADDLLARLEGGHDNLTVWGVAGDFRPIVDQSQAVSMSLQDPVTGVTSTPSFSRSMNF